MLGMGMRVGCAAVNVCPCDAGLNVGSCGEVHPIRYDFPIGSSASALKGATEPSAPPAPISLAIFAPAESGVSTVI